MGRNLSQVSENEKVDISRKSSEKGLSVYLLTIKYQGRPAFNVKIALKPNLSGADSASFLHYAHVLTGLCFVCLPFDLWSCTL